MRKIYSQSTITLQFLLAEWLKTNNSHSSLKIILSRQKKERGFTLLDVVLSILLASIFILVSLQAMVIATYLRVRAQQTSEAVLIIQEDLENIKYIAATLGQSFLSANANLGSVDITLADATEFTNNDTLKIAEHSLEYQVTNKSNNILTISPPLNQNSFLNDMIINTTKCKATLISQGFGDRLRDKIVGSDLAEATTEIVTEKLSKIFPSQQYSLKKTMTISAQYPYNILQLQYQVTLASGGDPLADLDTEVIPDAAFKCQ